MSGGDSAAAAYISDEDEDEKTPEPMPPRLSFTEQHKLLKLRLAPLRRVQGDLERRLGSGAEEPIPVPRGVPTVAAPFDANAPHSSSSKPAIKSQEFYVRSSTGWKGTLEKLRVVGGANSREEAAMRDRREREDGDTTAIIAGCREDIEWLWADETVRMMLDRRKRRLEDGPGLCVPLVSRIPPSC